MTDVSISDNLREAMRQYQEQRLAMAGDLDVSKARTAEQTAYHRLEAAQAAVEKAEAPYRKRMAEIAEYIEGNALEVGQTFEFAGVEVKHRKGYDRTTYDKKKLDKLVDELRENGNRTIAQQIIAARKVSTIEPKAKVSE